MKLPVFAVLATLLGSTLSARADIAWERNYEAAVARSRATGKPLFIDFFTDWCGWCKKLDASVFPDARVQRLARSFVMLKLDAEREGASAARSFGVRGYPTLLLVPVGGQPTKVGGYVPADGLAASMQQLLQSATKTAATQGTHFSASFSKWQNQLERRRANSSGNPGGAFLLDENGSVALDVPAKKTKKQAKLRVRTAKKPQNSAGY